MKKRQISIIILLGLMIVCNSCLFKPFEPDLSDYFPLKVGNTWVYETGHSGNKDTITHIVSEKVKIKGVNYFMFEHSPGYFFNYMYAYNMNTYKYGPMRDSTFVRKDDFGNIMLYYDTTEYLFTILNEDLLDSTIDCWINNNRYESYNHSIVDSVSTSFGTFYNCYEVLHYFPEWRDAVYIVWYAPGYGPVKIYEPSWSTTYDLIDIDLK